MKKQLFHLAITFAFLFMISTEIKSVNPNCDNPPEYTPILLQGHLDFGSGPNGVEAYYYANSIYVYFNNDFGNVSITLYNESGLSIYTDVINTNVQHTVIIPISGAPSGTYTLVLESVNGYAEGYFGKEP